MKSLRHLLLCLALPLSHMSAQHSVPPPTRDLWNDPAWVAAFSASYGILSAYEPPISSDEKRRLGALAETIQSNPSAAIGQLEAQIQADSSAAFDFILANLYFQQNELGRALQSYRSAIHKFPNFRRAYKNLGLAQVQSGTYSAAVKTLSKALQLGAVDDRSYGLLGYSYLTQELHYPAETAYRQAILMNPAELDWKLGLARCLIATQRNTDAIALFDTLIKEYPDRADFWLLQANAYIGNDEPIAAARNIEMVRRMGQAELASLSLLGDIYINLDAVDLALDAYLAALQLADAQDSQSMIRAAEILIHSEQYAQGKSMLAATRQHFGNRLDASGDRQLASLEAKIARHEGDSERALRTLLRIIETDALNGDALIEIGQLYAAQGDLPPAIHRFEQAARIAGYERKALIAHAQALVTDGAYQQALPLLRRALELQAEPQLQKYLQRVERAARNTG
jgi:tetratricopeptide (TPR) repeat protein